MAGNRAGLEVKKQEAVEVPVGTVLGERGGDLVVSRTFDLMLQFKYWEKDINLM